MTKAQYLGLLLKSAEDGTFPSAEGWRCRYRADSTAACEQRCAVGLLIPDEKYTPAMERRGVREVLREFPGAVDIPDGMDYWDMANVQAAHDDWVSLWRDDPARGREGFLGQVRKLSCFEGVEPEPFIANGEENE